MKKTIFEIIESRKSWRTFKNDQFNHEKEELKSLLKNLPKTPFGTSPRLFFIDQDERDSDKNYKMGTYGFIKGAKSFMGGVTHLGDGFIEDFGYVFEWAILKATDLGLGTCWLGGTFSREQFAKAITLSEGEIIPCVSPFGFGTEKRGMVDSLVAYVAKSSNRKNFSELFFDIDMSSQYKRALEMVRLAPSASNRQPWRVFQTENKRFDFYIKRTKFYDKMTPIDLQKIDMGIAMCHFELSCQALNLKGQWVKNNSSAILKNDLEYSVSWEILN